MADVPEADDLPLGDPPPLEVVETRLGLELPPETQAGVRQSLDLLWSHWRVLRGPARS